MYSAGSVSLWGLGGGVGWGGGAAQSAASGVRTRRLLLASMMGFSGPDVHPGLCPTR